MRKKQYTLIDGLDGMPCIKRAHYNGGSFFYEGKEVLFSPGYGSGIMCVIARAISGLYGSPLPITVADDFYYMAARYGGYQFLDDIHKCTFFNDEFYLSTYGKFCDDMKDQVYYWDMDGGSILNIDDKSYLPDELGFLWPRE